MAAAIEHEIETRNLEHGYKLGTKTDLRDRFDVGIGTINEALRLLVSHGAVDLRPGAQGGVFVASPAPFVRLGRKMLELSKDSVSVADCLMVRNALDPLVISQATQHRSADDIEALRRIADEMSQDSLSSMDFLRINWRLHLRILEIVPSPVVRHMYGSLMDFVQQRVLHVNEDVADRAHSRVVHRDLVEAIASGDQKLAAKAVSAHQNLLEGGNFPGGQERYG
ncbi:FadR/GntR family transcriptional regulator [Micromonospora radicis]|uniref:FadR/GntR family transcriptional regulator n=1 Tax=Micromonospora radicis TaxID=1894971 RepID=UPI0018F3CF62|nr:FCD domain-containing protein [Micromonospora radicis]